MPSNNAAAVFMMNCVWCFGCREGVTTMFEYNTGSLAHDNVKAMTIFLLQTSLPSHIHLIGHSAKKRKRNWSSTHKRYINWNWNRNWHSSGGRVSQNYKWHQNKLDYSWYIAQFHRNNNNSSDWKLLTDSEAIWINLILSQSYSLVAW